jgi:acyl carrier protein
MSTNDTTTEALRTFVAERLKSQGKTAEFTDHDDLLANGLIDSLGVVQLVSFVERKFDTVVPDEDVTTDNFQCLKDVAAYLERRKQARASS